MQVTTSLIFLPAECAWQRGRVKVACNIACGYTSLLFALCSPVRKPCQPTLHVTHTKIVESGWNQEKEQQQHACNLNHRSGEDFGYGEDNFKKSAGDIANPCWWLANNPPLMRRLSQTSSATWTPAFTQWESVWPPTLLLPVPDYACCHNCSIAPHLTDTFSLAYTTFLSG